MMRRVLAGMVMALMMAPRLFAAESTISVEGAWARPSLGAGGASAVYFTLRNKGAEADTLIGVLVPAAASASLHESKSENGVAKMLPLQSVEIPPGGAVAFEPRGRHVMLTGLKAPLKVGDSLVLTLDFKKAGALGVSVPIRNAAPDDMAGMDMGH